MKVWKHHFAPSGRPIADRAILSCARIDLELEGIENYVIVYMAVVWIPSADTNTTIIVAWSKIRTWQRNTELGVLRRLLADVNLDWKTPPIGTPSAEKIVMLVRKRGRCSLARTFITNEKGSSEENCGTALFKAKVHNSCALST